MPLHHRFTSVARRAGRSALLLALVALVGSPAATASAEGQLPIDTVTSVLINNTDLTYTVFNGGHDPDCAGSPKDDSPNTSGTWNKQPTLSPIAIGSATDWSFTGERFYDSSDVEVCKDDAGRQAFRAASGWDWGKCVALNAGPDTCTPVDPNGSDGGDPLVRFFRLGPAKDPQVVVVSNSKYVPGLPVTLAAQLTFGSAAGASLVPRGSMSFDLGPNGTGNCANVQVVSRSATCQATFSGTSPQRVTASYAGDFQFLPGSGSTTVTRLGPMVQAPYLPSSGPGWQDGAQATDYPYRDIPGTPLAIAASHDGKAMAALSNTGALYARVDDSLQDPQPDFTPMFGANGQPMIASAVTIDTNPVNGEVQLAAIGGDGRIWHRTKPRQGNWSGWGSPGPDYFQATDLTLSIDNTGTAHVGAIGLDHNINYRTRHPDGNWDGWQLVRATGGDPITATHIALAAATTGPNAGAVELDLIGYRGADLDHHVYSVAKAPGPTTWGPQREILSSTTAPFTRLAAGRLLSPLNGTATDIGLVVATTGANAAVTRTLRTNSVWGDRAAATATTSGWSGLAISTTPNGQGIGFTTWH